MPMPSPSFAGGLYTVSRVENLRLRMFQRSNSTASKVSAPLGPRIRGPTQREAMEPDLSAGSTVEPSLSGMVLRSSIATVGLVVSW